ncbi:MAG: SDR family oxidoreductase [Stappiaceae bacterium]
MEKVPDYAKKFDLTGRVAVITGGASGIGFAAAQALGQCGATLELIDMNAETLKEAVGQLSSGNITAHGTVLDVTDPQAVTDAALRSKEKLGPADILINSAGIALLHSVLDISPEDWNRVIDVDLNGTFWPSREFGRHMVEAGRGSIVNMGSMSGTIINRPQYASSYMAAKGAVHQLTRALAVEWAKTGVRVNALAPGYIATEMTLGMRAQPELFNEWLNMTPMGRCGTPTEVASAILFLASDASSYMTGAIVPIDGGYTCL